MSDSISGSHRGRSVRAVQLPEAGQALPRAVPPRKSGTPLRVVTAPVSAPLIRIKLSIPPSESAPARKPVRLPQTRPLRQPPSKAAAGGPKRADRIQAPLKKAKAPQRIPLAKATPRAAGKGRHLQPQRLATPLGQARWLTQRYRLLRPLGEGGTGTVYLAHDMFLDADVAVKIINKNLVFDKHAINSLKKEALTVMRLAHPHIVHLHTLDKVGPRYFLVMEYLEGNTLRGLLDVYGYLKPDAAMQVLSVCADALSYAHHKDVLHNDLKPENLMLTEDGVLKIIDFGISCLVNTHQKDFIMGTPAYMSPEQIRGEDLDARTDIYSTAVIAYEMLTGKTPFPQDAQFQDILDALPAPLPDIEDDAVRRVLGQAMAPSREDRQASIGAFVAELIDAAFPGQRLDDASTIKA